MAARSLLRSFTGNARGRRLNTPSGRAGSRVRSREQANECEDLEVGRDAECPKTSKSQKLEEESQEACKDRSRQDARSPRRDRSIFPRRRLAESRITADQLDARTTCDDSRTAENIERISAMASSNCD